MLERYVGILGLTKFANEEYDGYDVLTWEMLSMFSLDEKGNSMECRLNAQPIIATLAIMNEGFGFSRTTNVSRFIPKEFNLNEGWFVLSRLHN